MDSRLFGDNLVSISESIDILTPVQYNSDKQPGKILVKGSTQFKGGILECFGCQTTRAGFSSSSRR